MLAMGVMVLMQLFGAIRAFEIVFFTGTESKTDENGEKGKTFHLHVY